MTVEQRISEITMKSEDTVRVPAELSVSQLYSRLRDAQLLVEPLSADQPLAEFIKEGGIGWNSLKEGSFASTICKVKTSRFEYGSDEMTLYNVGYPLHRLVEGRKQSLVKEDPGEIERVTVYVRSPRTVKVVKTDMTLEEFQVPPEATNAFYVNNAGGKLLGLDDEGFFAVYPANLTPSSTTVIDGLWDNRFFAQRIPSFRGSLKVHTVRSNLLKIRDLSEKTQGVFFALATHLGFLVVVSGKEELLKQVNEEIESLPMTYTLSG